MTMDALNNPKARADALPDVRKRLGVVLLLALATGLAHGWSLFDGLALDDHWHHHTFQESSWSPGELLDATTIDTRNHLSLWWQERAVRFVYARPVSVALLKATYDLTGGSPVAAHLLSLLLHFVGAWLVYRLAWALTRRLDAALLAGLLFVTYPASMFAVSWLAAQNMVLQTVLMLGALLCYLRASGLRPAVFAEDRQALGLDTPAAPAALRGGMLAWTVVLWVGALLSRENAIMLPGILVAFDLAYGGWRHVRARLGAYIIFAIVGVAFLIWRLKFFYEPMPDVYVRRDGDGYLLWCVAKLLHYLCTSVWPAPMVIGPTGRYHPFASRPIDMAAMAGLVILAAALYVGLARRARGYWIWPAWIVLAVLPVTPVMATPHSGYLCGVAFAIGATLALNRVHRSPRRLVAWSAIPLSVLLVLVHVGALKCWRLMWMGMVYAETFTTRSMELDPPEPQVTDVFFLNLPLTGVYAKQCFNETLPDPREDLEFHALTFAPHLLRMEERCLVEREGDNALTLEVLGEPYFSGLLGRFLIDAFRDGGPFAAGDRFSTEAFDVEILAAEPAGVRKLRYTFRHSLDDPRYCFYLVTYESGALRLRFLPDHPVRPVPAPPATVEDVRAAAGRARKAGDLHAADALFAGLYSDDPEVRGMADTAVRHYGGVLARALGSPVQQLLLRDVALADHAEELWAWWCARVDPVTVRGVVENRKAMERLRHRRDEIKRARALAGRYIHSDLLLTGPPFPGPKP